MTTGWAVAASMALVACGCALKETKVAVAQTPQAVRDTIQRELVGAELEDIAKKPVDGQVVYETDIIRNGRKWEVVIREDGTILFEAPGGPSGLCRGRREQRRSSGTRVARPFRRQQG